MDMIKAQMMTMNGKNNNIIYVFIATGFINFCCKTIFPEICKMVNEYWKSKLKSNENKAASIL